jgi:hypothetical protein
MMDNDSALPNSATKPPPPSDLMNHFFEEFKHFEEVNAKGISKSKWSGKCKICTENKEKHTTFKDILGTTSNFCSHLRNAHGAEYTQYQERLSKNSKAKPLPKGQSTLHEIFAKSTVYGKTDPQQVKITESYLDNLVIKNMLPIYLCETDGFRDFMKDVDPKWRPCSGKWVSGVQIPQKYAMSEEKLKSFFAHLDDLSATIDIWSDRRMRGFRASLFTGWIKPLLRCVCAVLL